MPVGNSWGGALVAHYMAAHPQHIEKAAVGSPGVMWAPAYAANVGDLVPWSTTRSRPTRSARPYRPAGPGTPALRDGRSGRGPTARRSRTRRAGGRT
ncbi:hypothetical protein HA039_04045 [Streptomyces liangshanensis]|uniref:Alpha/beta hydrolase n=1 Tax=Streptomyces liangshanensis TaxID=2717324 RepID=A0A6G9GTP0_9ACTN|nr:hypothetical protein HA039_04045 [Streptomyces liangshanensis]